MRATLKNNQINCCLTRILLCNLYTTYYSYIVCLKNDLYTPLTLLHKYHIVTFIRYVLEMD